MKYLLFIMLNFVIACDSCKPINSHNYQQRLQNLQQEIKQKNHEIAELKKQFNLNNNLDNTGNNVISDKNKPKNIIKNTKITNHTEQKRFGLANKGSTCFLNATTQSLFASSLLIDVVNEELLPKDNYQERKNLLHALRQLKNNPSDKALNEYIKAYKDASKAIIKTEEVGGIKGGEIGINQCDAMDFLRSTLDFLGYSIKLSEKIVFNDNTFRYKNIKDNFIMLDIKEKEDSLDNLLKKRIYIPEEMTDNNQIEYDADKKGNKQDAKKYFIIDELPKTFFIALKRFAFKEKNGDLTPYKLNNSITPNKKLKFKIGDKEKKEASANLKSIVIHSGSTGGGHYYSYVYDKKERKWFEYNDSSVSEISEEKALSDASVNGYIFAYELEDKK